MAKYKYVYGLMSPLTPLQPCFYVGKGSGDRKVQHFRSIPKALQGEPTSEKYKIIEEIKAAGLSPSVVIFSHHDTDDEAYAAEQKMIEKIGQANLTNKSKGGEGVTTKGKSTKAKVVKLTPKEEQFCQLIASGSAASNTDAYRSAYQPKTQNKATVNRSAKTLVDKPKIAARIEELRAPVVKKLEYTYEGQLKKFENAYALAEETGNAGAMSGAVNFQTKLLDLYPADKLKVDVDMADLVSRLHRGRIRADDNDV